MSTVGIRDLQHHLKELLDAVMQGHPIVVTRRNRPVARIVPFGVIEDVLLRLRDSDQALCVGIEQRGGG